MIFASLLASALLPCALASPQRRATVPFPINGNFDYQIGGSYTPASNVKIVSRDHADSPVAGLWNICYINAFQTQPEDASWWKTNYDSLLLRTSSGAYYEDSDWPGEYLLDTTTDAKRSQIATILQGWIAGCASKGFQAIEPDNLDTYTRTNLLTQSGNLALAKKFTDYAHSLGLLVAQKNTADLAGTGKTTAGFDFAIAEECQVYGECASYTNAYGQQVIEIEYSDNGKSFYTSACTARGASIPIIYRDRDVVPSGKSDYVYLAC